MNSILVVGGYGDVGKYVVEELLSTTTKEIIVAGRNKNSADKLIEELNEDRLIFKHINIYDSLTYTNKLPNVEIVIMCLNPNNNDFAKYCLKNSINYIDISPSNQTAHELNDFHEDCKNRNVLCVLGAGICPGLSTLLVKDASKDFDSVKEIKLTLMLGVGDEYGKDAIQWLLTNLSKPFTTMRNGIAIHEEPFIHKLKVNLPQECGGSHSAYAFNLSDQQIIRVAHNRDNVSTYFCYDLKSITWLVHILARVKLFKLLKFPIARKIITSIVNLSLKLSKPISSNVFAINTEIIGYKNKIYVQKCKTIVGTNSPKTTGKVIAQTVAHIINEKIEFGVFHLSQLFDLDNYKIEIRRI